MRHATPTEFRKNLAKMMDAVVDDSAPLLVTRSNGRSVVVLSLDDYEAMDETAYLLAHPENKKQLLDAIARVESGETVERDLIEE